MTFMDRVSALLSRKSSRGGAAVAAVGLAPARWTPRRYDRLAEEGYRRNVVAYRCIREVSRACASVPWLLYRGTQEFDTHPLLDLLRAPNPRQSGPSLIETAVSQLLLSGNAYLEVVRPSDGSPPRELYALRPDRMRVVPDISGVPRAYRYEVEGRTVDWPVDPMTGESDVLHLREFHPLDDWYGLSPIEAAASAIDQHNAAAEHNAALLQNGARPSGALVFRTDPGPDGIRRVEEALLDRTHGPANAGRPLVLGGDVDWKELGFSPRDMDFAEMKAQAAREISAAFGVPHLLVVAGEATYANRADARLELWEHTVIPMLDRLASALSAWLGPMFGEGLRLATDLDEIPALAPRRRMKWQQIQQADFLSLNEKRQALGYAAVAEASSELKNSENYERVYGRPEPRNPRGVDGAGRWVAPIPQSSLIVPVRRFFDGPTGSAAGDPDCQAEWMIARIKCQSPAQHGATWRSMGRDYASCIMGNVSARCGGNRVKSGVVLEQTGNKCGCAMPLDPAERAYMTPEEIQRYELLDELNALFEVGDRQRVIARTTEILQSQPDDIGVLRWRAHAHATLGDEKACRDDYARVLSAADRKLQEDPQTWHRWMDRADAHDALGNRQAAYDDYSRVIELKSDVWMPFVRRAEIGLELGRFADSLKDAETAKELNWSEEDTMFDYLRSLCYVGLGDLASARSCVKTVPDSDDPSIAEMHRVHVEGCAALERRLALEAKALTPFEAATGQDQPRDDLGRWSEAGRSGDAGNTRVASRSDVATDASSDTGSRRDPRPDTVDWPFIDGIEGSELIAKVPPPKDFPKSGVTIGSGFDIGQRDAKDFDALQIELRGGPTAVQALKEKLRPFFGKKGQAAADALTAAGGLTISDEEAAALSHAAAKGIYSAIRENYDRGLGKGAPEFEDLPRAARNVIVSVAYQHGANLKEKTPKFWEFIRRRDWAGAAHELRNWTTDPDYPPGLWTRRRTEAVEMDKAARDAGF